MRCVAIICSALLTASFVSLPALAQQKTVKECQQEWRANKAANQARGITEKAYVAQCRSGGAAAQPAPAVSTTAKPKTKSSKEKTTTAPAPTSTPAARPAASSAPPARASAAQSGANQYSTETQAQLRCGSGTVVWVNLSSKIYHFSGHKDYGNTKSGAYMCEADAMRQGMRAAKNEKHP